LAREHGESLQIFFMETDLSAFRIVILSSDFFPTRWLGINAARGILHQQCFGHR
jgi:hypothetical protein